MHAIRLSFAIILVGAMASCATLQDDAARPPKLVSNAVWSDTGENKSIQFWLYKVKGDCRELGLAKPIVFAPPYGGQIPTGPVAFDVLSMQYCHAYFDIPRRKPFNACVDGVISYEYEAAGRRFLGKYEITLDDGSTYRGDFTALYCAPAQ